MRKFAIIAIAALATPVLAADLAVGTHLGTTVEAVQASLAEMGYEVRKGEMEDGEIEVYFIKDGEKAEVYVSPETGAVTKLDLD